MGALERFSRQPCRERIRWEDHPMKLQVWTALAAGVLLTASAYVAGCSSSTTPTGTSSTSSSGSGSGGSTGSNPSSVPNGTAYTGSAVTCSVGDAWEVPAGDPAPDSDPSSGLSCSVDPVTDPATGDDVYCCFDVSSGSTCTADASLTADCQAACAADASNPCQPGNVFGFTCASGDDPTSLDPSLNCSADPSATGNFCCE
jgi:hypothetical protein